jgi:two-component system OmpR family sensor kinase
MAKPLKLLRAGFAAVAQGDLDTRLQASMGARRDEVADLGRDFDHMVSRLQAVLGAQRQLLHDVSHELRSPLARLQAAIGLARQSPQRQAVSLDRIEREAARLDELVGEVLALSRLQTDRPGEPLERADLNELVRAIADDARFEAQAAGRDVALDTGAPLLMPVRRELLQRAVENVVRNAVKFTAPGTCVHVRVSREDAQAVIEVDDRGPGVASDELDAIFTPFHRGRQTEGVPGFGLGLAIAQRAVQAHRGTIVARNQEAGGLRMRITLPLG